MPEFRSMVLKNKWTAIWCTTCLLLISAALVFSRAALSVASILIVLPFIFNAALSRKNRIALVGVLLIILPVLVSGIWSDDFAEWRERFVVRLPLLCIALGCSATTLSRKQWLLVSVVFITAVFAGCSWSLLQYFMDHAAIDASYLRAKVLPTLADGDYVRFSWMVMIAVLLSVKCVLLITYRICKILLIGLIIFFVAYLHILAAKTGLICLYASGIIYIVDLAFRKRKWKLATLAVLLAMIVAGTAYLLLPTLHNRIQYVRYDFSLYARSGAAPGYNDAARWVSIRAGYDLTRSHPVTGVGFGDIRSGINQWHEQNLPTSFTYERFLPANEWLVYGAGSGFIGMILFTAGLFLILYKTTSAHILSLLLSVVAIIPLISDDTLEGQFGAVLLGFISFFGQQNPSPHE